MDSRRHEVVKCSFLLPALSDGSSMPMPRPKINTTVFVSVRPYVCFLQFDIAMSLACASIGQMSQDKERFGPNTSELHYQHDHLTPSIRGGVRQHRR